MVVAKKISSELSVLPISQARELSLRSTLGELPLYDFSVRSDMRGGEVAQAFQDNPLLPGVILIEHDRLLGMISRRRFLEYMSRPYGLELFLKRPIKSLYLLANSDSLIFPSDTLIVMAARRSLQRSAELLYEPIVVEIEPTVYRLLDAHQLLVAQSHIHELASQLIHQLYQELEKANHELRSLATADGLTKVANRRRFDEYLDNKWHELAREQAQISLILCDIDCFKGYNDTYGHLGGDACLQQVAHAISAAVKRPADLVARYGGEEFAVILPNTPAAGAVRVAEEIRMNVKGLQIRHINSCVEPYVTLSVGVATMVPEPGSIPIGLIAAADHALYQSKASGRDRVSVCA
ncbi:diguanylate cyclase [Aerosakkonema funiforme]|uniref:GGDEF domain-containing protein n=1 Tax=Aerosakkonema funiforme TaxID=1246630 RepID=UPI0035B9FCFC